MQLNILTSNSNPIAITDMKYLYDLAKCSKCQSFIVLKSTNKMYGVPEDSCCIHEIDIPFLVNTDLMFNIDIESKAVFEKYTDFFIPEECPIVILPLYYWDMYYGGDIEYAYDKSQEQYFLLDKTTKTPIDQIHMYKYNPRIDFERINFMNQLECFLKRQNNLGPVLSFDNMENNEYIRQAYDNKKTMGRVLCKLKYCNRDIAFYFFKGLFSLSKSDSLSIDIRFDMYETETFMATFKPKKKKNPLTFNTYGVPFSEKIHCMYRSIV